MPLRLTPQTILKGDPVNTATRRNRLDHFYVSLRRTLVSLSLFTLVFVLVALAQQNRDVLLNGSQIFPESITSTSDGALFIGSSANGAVYRSLPNASRADIWIAPGTSGMQRALGVLADEKSKLLWVCAPASPPNATSIKTFDLKTGAFKSSYAFAGGGGCNDMAVASDGTVYATDFAQGRVMRLRRGATEFEPWQADPQLASADGIALLADGAVYVNTFRSGFLFRIQINPDGSAGSLVKLRTARALVRPDGMRPIGAKTFLMVEGEGRLVEVTIAGDEAQLRLIRDGFSNVPAAVTLVGKTAYVIEAKFNYRSDPALRGQDPGSFQATGVPYSLKN